MRRFLGSDLKMSARRQVACRLARAVAALVPVAVTFVLALAGCEMAPIESAERSARPADPAPRDTPPESGTPESAPPAQQPGSTVGFVITGGSAMESDGTLRFTVSVSGAASEPVSVAYASEDGTATAATDYAAVSGRLTFTESGAARHIDVRLHDDQVDEPTESFVVLLSEPLGAPLAVASAAGTIVDDDTRGLRVTPPELLVKEGESASYEAVLASRPTGVVTVTIIGTARGEELTVAPERLTFTPANWTQPQKVTVTAAQDADAVADEPAEFTHRMSGGGYGETDALRMTVTIVEDDASTLAVVAVNAREQTGVLRFPVRISVASGAEVTVRYATGGAGDTATSGEDYTAANGTLTFPAHSTATQTIEVRVNDDNVDEPDETLTLTLSEAVNAALTGGGQEMAATGTIEDDDPPPQLSIADGNLTEGEGAMPFEVSLNAASSRTVTVAYATSDGTATAPADYASVSGTLTFLPGATRGTVAVTIVAEGRVEGNETFMVTLSHPTGATLNDASATGTISDAASDQGSTAQTPVSTTLELRSLQVTGGDSAMYPDFAGAIHHYALFCASSDTLQVTAAAASSTASLTLLRATSSNNHESTGSLDQQVAVGEDHDIAIELSENGKSVTYVVHCLPDAFPDVTILTRTEGASDGLLLLGPELYRARRGANYRYQAIVDYNGVPRYHRRGGGKNFRPLVAGMTIAGRQVRFSRGAATLLDKSLAQIRNVSTQAVNHHDFMITGDATFLFVVYKPYVDDPDDDQDDRDFTAFPDITSTENMKDGVIREVNLSGDTVFEWNSWDHLKLADCRLTGSVGDYSHLNSLYLVDGDIVASFKNCDQVVRIDRSSGTGALEWQLGGTAPPRDSDTKYLTVKDEHGAADEICKQHSAVVTNSGSILIFDNGENCAGPRKGSPPSTRVVEYDISSGTTATLIRKVEPGTGQGYSDFAGSVRELDNGNWLISWGRTGDYTVDVDKLVSISEVQPDGTTVFALNMSKSPHFVQSYRAYLIAEADVSIPLNLP